MAKVHTLRAAWERNALEKSVIITVLLRVSRRISRY